MVDGRLAYRPEIDGLRAVAVVSVFLYHLDRASLPGGFVGVDVFFVISGFLITSILCADWENGRIDLRRFYQRRIARIAPAFFLVALATIAAASIFYSAQDFASSGANLAAAALSLANVKYMLQGNYFQTSEDAQPFLHYWSLSVEEQFYLLFPLLLLVVMKMARRSLSVAVAVLGIGSLLACIVVTNRNPTWAFYLLPTRAWELSAGALLVVCCPKVSKGLDRWLPAIGITAIAFSIALIHEGAEFPGWHAMAPVAGAACIIAAGNGSHSRVRLWLSSRMMVAIGKISYSLYLWHWPVFSFVDYHFYASTLPLRNGLKVSISLALAVATLNFIEKPARKFLNRPDKRRFAFVACGAVVVVCLALGVMIRRDNYVNAQRSDVSTGGLVFAGRAGGPVVMLLGDSNGSMYGKVMKEMCADTCGTLVVLSAAAEDPLPALGGVSGTLWAETIRAIQERKPDVVFFAANWMSKLNGSPDRLRRAIDELEPHVGHIFLLDQPPILPREANRASIRSGGRLSFREDEHTRAARIKNNAYLSEFETPRVSVLRVASFFETSDGSIRFVDSTNRELYHDSNHLSGFGAEIVKGLLRHAVEAQDVVAHPKKRVG